MTDLDKWWTSLATIQKERIATKAMLKSGDTSSDPTYPACTNWWLSISEYKKHEIYQHCTDRHGLLLPEWKEGKSMSF